MKDEKDNKGSKEADTSDEDSEVLDEDDQDLLEELMRRVQDAGILEEELSTDLTHFTERVEGVMDSIDRIERIERSKMEKLLFKDGETTEDEEDLEGGTDERDNMVQYPDISLGQIQIPPPTPYKEVADGTFHPDEGSDLLSHYGDEGENVLSNLKRLIEIKLKRKEIEEATNLFNMARSIGGLSSSFRIQFSEIMESLGITTSSDSPIPNVLLEERETKVLDPDLAEGIDILEKRAKGALDQLNSLIESSDLSQEDFKDIKDLYIEATDLFREKRFHKAHQISLKGLQKIKSQAQDELETKIQDTLYRAKEMLERIEKEEKVDDLELLIELKNDIDMAMKAYLTNEYEKANLLSKKVLNTILDITEPDGGYIKERAKDLRHTIDNLKEKNILHEEISELETILQTAEQLIRRRDHASAERMLENLSEMKEEVVKRTSTYVQAKEIDIKLTNRMERLESSGYDLSDPRKKLNFLKGYLKNERFEDVLIIGADIERELSSLEQIREEIEAKAVFEELEKLMAHVEELEDHTVFVDSFGTVKSYYDGGDLLKFLEEGLPLRDELKVRSKTLGVERARRIANGIIESKILIMKMRGLNLDSMEMERRIRKAKNLLKEGSRTEGLKQMDQINIDMKRLVKEHLEHMRTFTNIHRDSLEVIMDRHRDQPVIFHIKNRQVPLLRKMEELGRFRAAIDGYRKLGNKFSGLMMPEDKKSQVETELTECKFEIYKRKEQGMDISEPLSLYTKAQKLFGKGDVVPAEYLVEISRRYCEEILPLGAL